MKIRPEIIQFTHERLRYYSQLANIPMPILAVRTREILDMPRKYTDGRRTSAYKYWGVCYTEANTIFINIKKHGSRKQIGNTIAHEVVHMRYPYLAHGEQFEKRIRALQNGRSSRPPKHKYVERYKDNR